MNSGADRDSKLLEYLDAVIAGKEPQGEMDAEMRTTLDFARKMISLKDAPSKQYQDQLRIRLIHELAEQQKKEQGPWLFQLLRQPAWAASISAFLLVLITVVIMAAATDLFKTGKPPYSGGITTSTTTATTTVAASTTTATQLPPSGGLMAAAASTDKPAYLSGQNVEIKISLKNDTADTLTINDFPPIVSVLNSETGLAVYTFERTVTGVTLPPFATTSYSLNWNQTTSAGTPAAPGNYYVELEDINYQGNDIKLSLTTPARFTITDSSPAGNQVLNTINVNVSQTENGETMTLQRIEITGNGFNIYANTSRPANYTSSQYTATADYSIDSGWFQSAGNAAGIIAGNNISFIWNIGSAIPLNAGELIITLKSNWDISRSWQFTVPLK
ncbi:MAG TPA: hypothetical protein VEH58_04970 [Dehalococcoidales bacterium]|nr:hypothetical protein [Dehalococcoidales bacterium]